MTRVLIVDDEELYLRASAALLRTAGLEVHGALRGSEGLDLLRSHGFDAVLVDLMMPQMSGIEFVRQAREISPNARLVLTSTFPLSARQIERLGVGDVQFVAKPSPLADLLAALGASEAAPSPRGPAPRVPPGHGFEMQSIASEARRF